MIKFTIRYVETEKWLLYASRKELSAPGANLGVAQTRDWTGDL